MLNNNNNESIAVIPQVRSVDWGTSIRFAGAATNADISAGLMTVGDVMRLTVASGRGDGSGRTAGGWLLGVEAGYMGEVPWLRVSLGLGSAVKDFINHGNVASGVVRAIRSNWRINKVIIKHRKWKVKIVNNSRLIWDARSKPKGLLGGPINNRSTLSKCEQVQHL